MIQQTVPYRLVCFFISVLLLSLQVGCSTAPSWQAPSAGDGVNLLQNADTASKEGVAVTVAIPGREEAEKLFGVSLASVHIQPVWIQVDNHSDRSYLLLKPGQVCLRPRDRFWDIPVPKIDSAFDNLLVPQPSWSPSTTQQLRKLVAAPYLSPNDWTPRLDAYFASPLALCARRVSSAASRLLGSTSLRFALHGWQRMYMV